MRFDATTPPQGTLRDWIDARADRGGTAFVFPETGETLTWPELRDHCAIVAGDLTAQGIAKGESIAVMHPNGYDGVKALFSALYGGFRVTMLNLAAGPDALGYAMDHSEARIAFVHETQLDVFNQVKPDRLNRLFKWMEDNGLAENTIIAFTSDHGDYMGDHWMGDKDFYHQQAVKVPLIIYDPRAEANVTRGTECDALVEQIDLAPTFMNAVGCPPKPWIVEGRDLTPLLHGKEGFSRNYVISEHDYHWSEMARMLDQPQEDAHTVMIFDGRWKYIRCEALISGRCDPHASLERQGTRCLDVL